MPIIFHFDIDAFFAAVEVLLDPSLKGKPVIVGGSELRGVVSTASYEARRFGVRSAMSTAMAKQLCPHGIFIRGEFDAYRKYSKDVFEIASQMSGTIEKVGIDEGYLDMTSIVDNLYASSQPRISNAIEDITLDVLEVSNIAKGLAMKLKQDVHTKTGLTISIGISYNKFLAKLASDWKKPDGLFIISRENAQGLLDPLPLIKVHGLGKKTAEKLNRVGLYTVQDLRTLGQSSLSYLIGESWAQDLYPKLCGEDPRPLVTHYARKSYGRETTFDRDVTDKGELISLLSHYLEALIEQIRHKSLLAKTITIKMRYDDFTQHTHSHSLLYPSDQFQTLNQAMCDLFMSIPLKRPVRLIGVSLTNLSSNNEQQLSLMDTFF